MYRCCFFFAGTDVSAGVCLVRLMSKSYITDSCNRSIPRASDFLFSHLPLPTMSNALKRRKIAVLGSRSVGEFRFLNDEGLENFLIFLGKSSLVKQFVEV